MAQANSGRTGRHRKLIPGLILIVTGGAASFILGNSYLRGFAAALNVPGVNAVGDCGAVVLTIVHFLRLFAFAHGLLLSTMAHTLVLCSTLAAFGAGLALLTRRPSAKR